MILKHARHPSEPLKARPSPVTPRSTTHGASRSWVRRARSPSASRLVRLTHRSQPARRCGSCTIQSRFSPTPRAAHSRSNQTRKASNTPHNSGTVSVIQTCWTWCGVGWCRKCRSGFPFHLVGIRGPVRSARSTQSISEKFHSSKSVPTTPRLHSSDHKKRQSSQR